MLDKEKLQAFITGELSGSGCFLTDLHVTADNVVTVEIDSMQSVSIEQCEQLSRAIGAEFDRDVEDYELEVGSAGLTSPFKVPEQYEKNIGNDVEVLTRDGRKLKGVLVSADSAGFSLRCEKRVKEAGEKRPKVVSEDIAFGYDEVKYAKYLLKF